LTWSSKLVRPSFRAFQSNAVLSAFSTASPPPAIQKWCGNPSGVARVGRVEIGVRDVGAGRRRQRREELGLLEPRMPVPQRPRSEARERIEVLVAGARVVHPRPV
jgi:hypothetical protein